MIYTADRQVWRQWLTEHFETEKEVWLVYPSKQSGEPCILYNDAVEEALCFGWIDSTIKHIDDNHRAQRFTPRNPRSTYSRPNIERLIWLDEQNLIHPSVKPKVDDLIHTPFVFPGDILEAIKAEPEAWKFYQQCSEGYRRIRIAYIDDARPRPEEFEKRLRNFIAKTKDYKKIVGYGGIDKYYR